MIVDLPFSSLFAALLTRRFELTVNLRNMTAGRAKRMLETEPFFATARALMHIAHGQPTRITCVAKRKGCVIP